VGTDAAKSDKREKRKRSFRDTSNGDIVNNVNRFVPPPVGRANRPGKRTNTLGSKITNNTHRPLTIPARTRRTPNKSLRAWFTAENDDGSPFPYPIRTPPANVGGPPTYNRPGFPLSTRPILQTPSLPILLRLAIAYSTDNASHVNGKPVAYSTLIVINGRAPGGGTGN